MDLQSVKPHTVYGLSGSIEMLLKSHYYSTPLKAANSRRAAKDCVKLTGRLRLQYRGNAEKVVMHKVVLFFKHWSVVRSLLYNPPWRTQVIGHFMEGDCLIRCGEIILKVCTV